MSVFTRYTLRSLAKNRTRTAVSIVGVALSVALITAVLTSVVSLSNLLLVRTAADEGWWYGEVANVATSDYERLRTNPDVTDLTGIADLGTVSLGEENSSLYGSYLYVKTWPEAREGAEPLVEEPELVAGRAPQAPGEIVLPHYLQNVQLEPCGLTTTNNEALAIGDTVTFDLGTRTVQNLDDGSTYVATSINGQFIDEDLQRESYAADLGQLSGTVVGFYRSYGSSSTVALQGNSAYV